MGKVLVTGGTGFIGNHVVRLCVEQGDDVRVMVMPGEDRSPLQGLEVEIVEGNLLDPSSLRRAPVGCARLYHLAALFAVWTKDPNLHYRINVDGARHMTDAAREAGVEKIVYTSSVAAIGVAEKGQLANEKTPFNGWVFGTDYILSKFMSHHVVKGLCQDGLPATLVLPGLPFGPGDRMPTPTGSIIVSTLRGKMKNYWDGGVCAVDVRDVARGHVLAMEKGRIGEFYILANSEGNMKFQQFLQLVGRVAGVAGAGRKHVSAGTMLRVARILEFVSRITGKAPMTTYRNTLFSLQECYVDPGKAIEELGLPQTLIEVAVRDSVEWFRGNGYA